MTLEAENAKLRTEMEELRYKLSPPTVMRCEQCGRDVDTACADCETNRMKNDVRKAIKDKMVNEKQAKKEYLSFHMEASYHQAYGKLLAYRDVLKMLGEDTPGAECI